MEPSVLVYGLGGLLGHLVVPFHHIVAATAELAHLVQVAHLPRLRVDYRGLYALEGLPHSAALPLEGRLVIPRLGHSRRGLRETVDYGHLAHVELLHHFFHRLDGARGPCHYPCPEAGEIEFVEELMIHYHDEHRGNAVKRSAPLGLHRGHHHHRVEALAHDHGRAVVYAGHYPQHATEAMEQRNGDAHPVLRPIVHVRPYPITVIGYVEVREHHALGEACGPGCVLHHGDVVHIHGILPLPVLLIGGLGGHGLDLGHGVHAAALLRPHEDHPFQMRIFLAAYGIPRLGPQLRNEIVNHAYVIGMLHSVYEDQILHVRLLQNIIQLLQLIIGVDGQEYGPDPCGREHQDDPVRHVGGPDRYLLPFLHSHGHEALGDPVDLFAELLPRETEVPVHIDQGIVVRVVRYAFVEQVPEPLVGRYLFARNAGHVPTSVRCVEHGEYLRRTVDCAYEVRDH